MSARGGRGRLPAGDGFLWFIGALAGAIATHLPDFALPLASRGTRLLVQLGAFFSLGCVLGVFAPRRPWRWAVAVMLLVPVAEWLWRLQPGTPLQYNDVGQVVGLIHDHAARYALLGLVAFLGSLLGGVAAAAR